MNKQRAEIQRGWPSFLAKCNQILLKWRCARTVQSHFGSHSPRTFWIRLAASGSDNGVVVESCYWYWSYTTKTKFEDLWFELANVAFGSVDVQKCTWVETGNIRLRRGGIFCDCGAWARFLLPIELLAALLHGSIRTTHNLDPNCTMFRNNAASKRIPSKSNRTSRNYCAQSICAKAMLVHYVNINSPLSLLKSS